MAASTLVVIGASSGGVQALQAVVADLPPDLAAAVAVVLHIHPSSPGYLGEILNRAGPIRARQAIDGETLEHGRIYVAAPDKHLIITSDHKVELSHGPRENHARPAVDPLFRSAALAFGTRTLGVILTGYLDDGASGLRAIKLCGGTALVQDPRDAEAPGMPASALKATAVDFCVKLGEIAPLIGRLVAEGSTKRVGAAMPKEIAMEAAIAAGDTQALADFRSFGTPSLFSCPDCHGTLMEIRDQRPVRFRCCHTGHAFGQESLRAALKERIEDALWNTVRALQERALLMRHLAEHARVEGDVATANTWESEASEAADQAERVRRVQAG